MNLANTLAILFAAGVLAASGQLWSRAFVRWREGKPLLEYQPRGASRLGLIDVLATALLMIAVPGAVVGALRATLLEGAAEGASADEPAAARISDDGDALSAAKSATGSRDASANRGGIREAVQRMDSGSNGATPREAVEEPPADDMLSPEAILAASATSLVACLLAIALVALRGGLRIDTDLGFTWRHWGEDLRLGLAAYAMLTPIVYAIQATLVYWFPSAHPLTEMFRERPTIGLFALAGFSAVIVAPLVEEFLFRGMLQGWFERLATQRCSTPAMLLGGADHPPPLADRERDERAAEDGQLDQAAAGGDGSEERRADDPHVPRAWPIVASSIFFAAMHASHGPDPIPLFVLAVGLGYLYQRTHRLLPCMVLHALLNATTLAALGLSLLLG